MTLCRWGLFQVTKTMSTDLFWNAPGNKHSLAETSLQQGDFSCLEITCWKIRVLHRGASSRFTCPQLSLRWLAFKVPERYFLVAYIYLGNSDCPVMVRHIGFMNPMYFATAHTTCTYSMGLLFLTHTDRHFEGIRWHTRILSLMCFLLISCVAVQLWRAPVLYITASVPPAALSASPEMPALVAAVVRRRSELIAVCHWILLGSKSS